MLAENRLPSLWGFVVVFRPFERVSRSYVHYVTTALFEILPRSVTVLELIWI